MTETDTTQPETEPTEEAAQPPEAVEAGDGAPEPAEPPDGAPEADGGAREPEAVAELRAAMSEVAAERDGFKARAEAAEAEAERLRAEMERMVIDRDLSAAMAEARVLPEYFDSIRAMFAPDCRVETDTDGRPVAFIDGGRGAEHVDAFIRDWSQTDDGKHFVAARQNGGGGAGRSTVPRNPWRRKLANGQYNPHFSTDEQKRLIAENPVRARRLAKEAGVPEHEITW